MDIAVTGASGFVGRSTCLELRNRDFNVRALSRTPLEWPEGITPFNFSSILDVQYSHPALAGVDCILHLAGRAHVMRESEANPLSAFMNSNCVETLAFAREASLAGVRRFVFVSTIKVNGEHSTSSAPFTTESLPNPSDPYAISKYEAELGLLEIASATGMEVVIVRPPLIYGPGVKGNLRLLMRLLASKVPLPLGMITENRRSLISLTNIIDFFDHCIRHQNASGRTFLVSDQFDVSTCELVNRLGSAMGLTPRLFPCPPALLKTASILARKYTIYQRLCGSLVVDNSTASHILDWVPPLDVDEGLRRAAVDFML